jgi:hypothetical protein
VTKEEVPAPRTRKISFRLHSAPSKYFHKFPGITIPCKFRTFDLLNHQLPQHENLLSLPPRPLKMERHTLTKSPLICFRPTHSQLPHQSSPSTRPENPHPDPSPSMHDSPRVCRVDPFLLPLTQCVDSNSWCIMGLSMSL